MASATTSKRLLLSRIEEAAFSAAITMSQYDDSRGSTRKRKRDELESVVRSPKNIINDYIKDYSDIETMSKGIDEARVKLGAQGTKKQDLDNFEALLDGCIQNAKAKAIHLVDVLNTVQLGLSPEAGSLGSKRNDKAAIRPFVNANKSAVTTSSAYQELLLQSSQNDSEIDETKALIEMLEKAKALVEVVEVKRRMATILSTNKGLSVRKLVEDN